MRDAPFAPLIAGGGGLRRGQSDIDALRRRMADIYDADEKNILPVRGRAHALEVLLRMTARAGGGYFSTADSPLLSRLADLYRVAAVAETDASAAFHFSKSGAAALSAARLNVIDETEIEFSDAPSCIPAAMRSKETVVIRSLEVAYGLAGAPCGALIANKGLVDRLAAFVEPDAVPPIIVNAALAALDPTRFAAMKARIAFVKEERARIASALNGREDSGPAVSVQIAESDDALMRLAAFGVVAERLSDDCLRLPVGTTEENERVLAAFGVANGARAHRIGEAVRETTETKIVATVDLDQEGACDINTGVGFFDHMLSQIVHHAGVSATLSCCGDLEIDAHHTIEDCAIAFGDALSKALGERRGIARFGFLLPMDEAEAKISIDLGGRPYLVFKGKFSAPLIGDYPTEMTEHVFRSLAQSLGAAIHLSVMGENDHHKTEACFKAFGRALRQAVRIEGETTPSTKGAIL